MRGVRGGATRYGEQISFLRQFFGWVLICGGGGVKQLRPYRGCRALLRLSLSLHLAGQAYANPGLSVGGACPLVQAACRGVAHEHWITHLNKPDRQSLIHETTPAHIPIHTPYQIRSYTSVHDTKVLHYSTTKTTHKLCTITYTTLHYRGYDTTLII